MSKIDYLIKGVSLRSIGVYVEQSSGWLGLPKPRAPKSEQWAEQHGSQILGRAVYYDQREITLKCFASGASVEAVGALIERLGQLLAPEHQGGTLRLAIEAGSTVRQYEVYSSDAIAPELKHRGGKVLATLSLKLIEPEPIKRVYRVAGSGAQGRLVSSKAVNIYWGDGTVSLDVVGVATLNHQYTDGKSEHLIVVSGDLRAIQSISINNATEA